MGGCDALVSKGIWIALNNSHLFIDFWQLQCVLRELMVAVIVMTSAIFQNDKRLFNVARYM